jgi:hypothetical protein
MPLSDGRSLLVLSGSQLKDVLIVMTARTGNALCLSSNFLRQKLIPLCL